MSLIRFGEAHSALIWVLFLAPVFLVLLRGYVLDQRFEKIGMKSRYHPMLFWCWVPVLGIVIALLCYGRWVYEHLIERPQHGYVNHYATW